MAGKTLLVAQREYLENVRTKTFWIGILAFPVILVLSLAGGWVLNRLKETKSYTVLDRSAAQLGPLIEKAARTPDLDALARLLATDTALTGSLAALQQELGGELAAMRRQDGGQGKELAVPDAVRDRLFEWFRHLPAADAEALGRAQKALATAARYRYVPAAALDLAGLPVDAQRKRCNELVESGRLFAYFVIGPDPVASLEGCSYVSSNLTDDDLRQWYADAATRVVRSRRIAAAHIDARTAQHIQAPVAFHEEKPAAAGATEAVEAGEKANKYAPMGFVYLLWIAVFTAAQMLLTNTVEEKSNRIIEVLLSSVAPGQLMAGKIWGIAATGLTIVGSWVACALLGVWLAPLLVAGFRFPLMQVIGDPLYLGSFVAYFLGGYLLYAAILVGLGSVCNSLKEAQNLLQPVFILLAIPLISMFFVVQEPNGLVARVLSYVPLFTPFTMMNRAGGPPAPYEYVLTSLLLAGSVWFAFRAAGKVFRVGVLMTGKPPRLGEILGWLRAQ